MFNTKSILPASIFTILPIINFPWNWKETDKNDKKGGAGAFINGSSEAVVWEQIIISESIRRETDMADPVITDH